MREMSELTPAQLAGHIPALLQALHTDGAEPVLPADPALPQQSQNTASPAAVVSTHAVGPLPEGGTVHACASGHDAGIQQAAAVRGPVSQVQQALLAYWLERRTALIPKLPPQHQAGGLDEGQVLGAGPAHLGEPEVARGEEEPEDDEEVRVVLRAWRDEAPSSGTGSTQGYQSTRCCGPECPTLQTALGHVLAPVRSEPGVEGEAQCLRLVEQAVECVQEHAEQLLSVRAALNHALAELHRL